MKKGQRLGAWIGAALFGVGISVVSAAGQAAAPPQNSSSPSAPPTVTTAPVAPGPGATPSTLPSLISPTEYIIGPDDILTIVFWRDPDMTKDVVVRPDGKVSRPVPNELQAGGRTPEQLRQGITEAASKFFEAPSINVTVKEIRSRRVFITGMVAKPGAYVLSSRMTVIQLIASAGGLAEFAKSDKIAIVRTDDKGVSKRYAVNYKDIMKGKNMKQNVELQVGDVVDVP